MHIGILETGRPPEALTTHGSYPDMFERLLEGQRADLTFTTYSAIDGDVPSDPALCDAWLITGSRHGVYEDLPWMRDLKRLIVAAVDQDIPVIGICFGHQIVAEALGGRVVKSDKGWGVGVHDYEIIERPDYMAGAPERVAINAVHQDQVVALPAGAKVLATSPFCENAVVAYGDKAFTVQAHPEFSSAYKRDLLESRLKGLVPEDVRADALCSLERELDSALVAKWIVGFLEAREASRQHNRAAASA